MNPISDERFYELAMKSIVGQCSAPEEAELQAELSQNADRAAELPQLRAQAAAARELLALVRATEATRPGLPVSARERLRKRVDETFGQPRDGWRGQPRWAKVPVVVDITEPPPVPNNPAGPKTDDPPSPKGNGGWKVLLWILVGAALTWVAYSFAHRPSPPSATARVRIVYEAALIQPMVGRSEKDYAPVIPYLKRTFDGCRVEVFKDGSAELRGWDNTHSQHIVKIKCYLEGGAVGRFRRVVSRVELRGWRGEKTFERSFDVAGDNWEGAILNAWSFDHGQE